MKPLVKKLHELWHKTEDTSIEQYTMLTVNLVMSNFDQNKESNGSQPDVFCFITK